MAEAIQSSNARNHSDLQHQSAQRTGQHTPSIRLSQDNRPTHLTRQTPQPNNRTVDTIIVNAPTQTGAKPQIEVDNALNDTVDRVLVEDVADPKNPTRHDPHKLAAAVVSCLTSTTVDD